MTGHPGAYQSYAGPFHGNTVGYTSPPNYPQYIAQGADHQVPKQQQTSQMPNAMPMPHAASQMLSQLTYAPSNTVPMTTPMPPGPAYSGQAYPAASMAPVYDASSSFGAAHMYQPSYPSTGLSFIAYPPEPLAFYEPPKLMDPQHMKYHRPTLQVIPNHPSLLSKLKLPLGIIINPYASQEEDHVPTSTGIILRCRKCRAYVNPYVEWYDAGARYKCNLCFYVNDVPPDFDYSSATQKTQPRSERPELRSPVVEFMAHAEYMVRAPQANTYLFLLDVSFNAVNSGSLGVISRTLLAALDALPNADGRTKVGFCLVDEHLTFVQLCASMRSPQLLVIPRDDQQYYLPRPDDILVTLTDARPQIEAFLQKLTTLFFRSNAAQPALGTALSTLHKLLAPVGGKIVCLLSSLPGLDAGALKMREDPALIGTEKELQLLQPGNKFYKDLAVEFSKDQICVDFFLLPSQFIDIASLSPLARFTGGRVFYYPGFKPTNEGWVELLTADLSHFLESKHSLESVLRVRPSKGLNIQVYYGNFFIRQTDLLSLANVNRDLAYTVELELDEPLPYNVAYIQTALLHTSANGERRIRVLTLPLKVSADPFEIFNSADPCALVNLMAKSGLELLGNGAKLETVRDHLFSRCLDILTSIKTNLTCPPRSASTSILCPENLKPFPLLLLGVLKSPLFRASPRVPIDLRSYYLALARVISVEDSSLFFCPTLYPLHTLPSMDLQSFYFPFPLNLTSEKLERNGIYLLDTGIELYLWLGVAAAPSLVHDLFGVSHISNIPSGKVVLPYLESEFNQYVHYLMKKLYMNEEPGHRLLSRCPVLTIVKEDCTASDVQLKANFLSHLILDRMESSPSYMQLLAQLRDKVNGTANN